MLFAYLLKLIKSFILLIISICYVYLFIFYFFL